MRILYTCFLISAILAVRGTAVAQSVPQDTHKTTRRKPATSIDIAAYHESVKAGSPVYVIVNLTNNSNRDIAFYKLLSDADTKIEVRDVAGKLVPETSYGRARNGQVAQDPTRSSTQDSMDKSVSVTVKAQDATTWSLNVGMLYDMTKPGKYRIRIQREAPENPKAFIRSNTVTVTVTP